MPNLTDIYFKNDNALDQGYKLVVNQGGQGSSKTYSILQEIYLISKYSKNRKISTICSYALPHLKLGAVRDFENILISWNENPDQIHNKTDHFFRIGNSIVDYFGIRDNLSKAVGTRRDFLYINELNNKITFDDFDQLNQRTRECTFVDYNPRCEFFLHDKILPYFNHKMIKSTFKDNPWLPEAEKQRILAKYTALEKAKELKNESIIKTLENWIRVYAEGELGQFEGVIFQNWKYGEFDTTLPHLYGLDFGFSPDPDTLIKTSIDRKNRKMYWDELFYKSGQGQNELKTNLEANVNRNDLIVADCAEKRLIYDLQKDFNIRPVRKTGTVAQWLRLMQDYEHIITETSHNLAKEFNNYVWNDKRAGIPIDAFNHCIDGGRYCFMEVDPTRRSRVSIVD